MATRRTGGKKPPADGENLARDAASALLCDPSTQGQGGGGVGAVVSATDGAGSAPVTPVPGKSDKKSKSSMEMPTSPLGRAPGPPVMRVAIQRIVKHGSLETFGGPQRHVIAHLKAGKMVIPNNVIRYAGKIRPF